ncbi:MAG: GH25 family lysozyme [Pseudomonadota bacterium]
MINTGNETTRKLMANWIIQFILAAVFAPLVLYSGVASANDFLAPWKNADQALVLDAYERNPIDWSKVVQNKQIRAFIGKSSDGLPPPYNCPMKNETEKTLCKKTFQNYWLKRELYHTRKTAAKNLGLKWGAYHLGRPGNPIDQANHFIDFAEPQPDELIALDIEHDDPEKWISFKDAEIFAKHIKHRLGRYPILYTNHNTAKRIALRRNQFPLLSRLPLWYARYKGDIRGVFPMGNWQSYALWQFSSHVNCNKRRCLYRVNGTQTDIDVNATGLTIAQLEEAWPFNELKPFVPIPDQDSRVLVAKASKPQPATRFKVSYTLDLGKRKKVKLTSIAVPTPRKAVIQVDATQVASVGLSEPSKLSDSVSINEKQLGMGSSDPFLTASATIQTTQSYSPVSYGYTTYETKYNKLQHHDERYTW